MQDGSGVMSSVGKIWLMGVGVSHLLERRWDASFLVVLKTQRCNGSDAGDSRMLKKQLLHALQD